MADLASRFYLERMGPQSDEGSRIKLGVGEQLVGCVADAAVHVAEEGVAPMHANLWVQHDAVYVTDLGSAQGTAINATKLSEGMPTALELGDEVCFGPAVFRLLRADQEQVGAEEAPVVAAFAGAGDLEGLAPKFPVQGAELLPALEEDSDGSSLMELAFFEATSPARLRGYFNTFCRFCHQATETSDRYQLLDVLLQSTSEVVKADRYFVLLGDRHDALKVRAARYSAGEEADRGLPSSEFVRRTFQAEKPVTTYDALADERFSARDSVIMHDVRSAIGVRLAAGGQTLGVLYLDSQAATGLFGSDDAELVHTLGNVASLKLLYLASRKALLDLLTKTRDEVGRYRELSTGLARQVIEHAERTDEQLLQRSDLPADLAALLREACDELRAAAAPYVPPPEDGDPTE